MLTVLMMPLMVSSFTCKRAPSEIKNKRRREPHPDSIQLEVICEMKNSIQLTMFKCRIAKLVLMIKQFTCMSVRIHLMLGLMTQQPDERVENLATQFHCPKTSSLQIMTLTCSQLPTVDYNLRTNMSSMKLERSM